MGERGETSIIISTIKRNLKKNDKATKKMKMKAFGTLLTMKNLNNLLV